MWNSTPSGFKFIHASIYGFFFFLVDYLYIEIHSQLKKIIILSFCGLTADLKLKLDFFPLPAIFHGVTKQHHYCVIDGAERTQLLLTGLGITAPTFNWWTLSFTVVISCWCCRCRRIDLQLFGGVFFILICASLGKAFLFLSLTCIFLNHLFPKQHFWVQFTPAADITELEEENQPNEGLHIPMGQN